MKKKLLLIPIALMSCFIAGCEYETYVVPLWQWLEHNGKMYSEPGFSVVHPEEEKSGGYRDYEEYVCAAIKSKVLDAEDVTKNTKNIVRTDSYVSYSLNCHIRKMEHCSINIFENGYITTYAYAETDSMYYFFGRPKDQKLIYKIEEDKAKEIIEIATNRYLEIKEEIETYQAELTNAAQIGNVINTFEQSGETLNISYTHEDSASYSHDAFPDNNRELLAELKTIEYEEADDFFITGKVRIVKVSYCINSDLVIAICNHILNEEKANYDLVCTRIRDKGKYPQSTYLYFFYKIDPQKGKALIQKVNQLYLDYKSGK